MDRSGLKSAKEPLAKADGGVAISEEKPTPYSPRQKPALQEAFLNETPEERIARLAAEEYSDTWTLYGCNLFALTTILINGFAMMVSALGYLEIAFALPFLTAPLVISSCKKLNKGRKRKERVFDLQEEADGIATENEFTRHKISLFLRELGKMKREENQLKKICEKQEYEVEMFLAMFQENKRINEKKKLMAEAITLQTLIQTVMGNDFKKNHPIGDSELNLISYRLQNINGVPFTGQELCQKFGRRTVRNVNTLIDVVRLLFIEKQREMEIANKPEKMKKSKVINRGAKTSIVLTIA